MHGYLHERSNEIGKEAKHSLRALLDAGIEYDLSLMGDDIPYALRDGDSNRSLLEFPTDWISRSPRPSRSIANRGKRSLALDLKRPEAAEIMCKAGRRFRLYVSISGVGESGPYARKRVYDPIIQGLSGFADLQAEPKTRRPQMIRTIELIETRKTDRRHAP